MHISDSTIVKLLERSGAATSQQLQPLVSEAASSNLRLQDIVLQNNLIDERTLTKLYATYADIPYIELDPRDIPSDILMRIPERIARQYNAVIFKIDPNGLIHLAMDDPDDVQAVNFIEKEIGTNTRVYIAPRSNILECLEGYRGDVTQELKEVIDIQREDDGSNQKVTEAEVAEDSPIAQTVNLLLEYAIRSNASDIHIEPREQFVQVRYRIDGVLKEVNRLPKNVLGALISRIKILSNLKIDERRVPQDGRFKIKVAGKQYALRVSTLPIADGEKVVMRILDESNQAVTLEQLGYWGHSLAVINQALTEPNGMILVTGPTGSGKSTSLFSVLSMLNTPEVNISTIEDPVEYKIPGVNQTQTNSKAGMTFASGLRALLRQDPNIIMVGEIRDGETANLGVQAALTGHLVFSTLHTNSAAGVLPRLLDMHIEPFLIASTVNTIIGQRLVRRIGPQHENYWSNPLETEMILGTVGHLLPKTKAEAAKISADLGYSDLPLAGQKSYRLVRGRDTANTPRGYSGRAGLFEVMEVTEEIQQLITARAWSTEIQKKAIEQGMITMRQDGYLKALQGITTLEEVNRVTSDIA